MSHNDLRTIAEAQRALFHHQDADSALPGRLRREALEAGLLDGDAVDVDFRARFGALDRGVYCANHSMGKPSDGWHDRMAEVHRDLGLYGIDAWEKAGWMGIGDRFRARVAELVGQDLEGGDVARFTSFSDALSALLFGMERGRVVATGGHFITGHYIHEVWGERTGSEVVTVHTDLDGSCPAERVVEALTPDTAVVSLAQGFWKTGWVQDLTAIAAAIREVCPQAVFAVDLYQTLGTVPCAMGELPAKTALLGGGIKQLRSGTGAGFGWFSNALLEGLRPTRSGWFAHREPMSFDPSFARAPGASVFRSGVPDVVPMASLVHELDALAAWTGSLTDSLDRAHRRTRAQVGRALERCDELGLEVVGRDWPMARRAAFFGIRVERGPDLVSGLGADGIWVDFRSDEVGGERGILRMSATAPGFFYELDHALSEIARRTRG